ncbi:MAG: hypothetical protein M9899_01415 [Bdellovibrionaceae bacterium]|nr:hypothetical protein [Pseudobdellovibrionaceae bacterium]
MPSHKVVKATFLLLIWTLTSQMLGCAASGVQLQNVDKSTIEIKRGIVKALPVNLHSSSEDNREFISVPFVRYGKKMKPARNELQRAYARILIKGDRRPYTIEVIVPVEEATTPNSVQKNFQIVGYDERIAKIILARLKAYLEQRRGDTNLVDDFRAF